jgi:hypothetical protein
MSLPQAKEVGFFNKVGLLLAVALSFMGIYRLDSQPFSIDYRLLMLYHYSSMNVLGCLL